MGVSGRVVQQWAALPEVPRILASALGGVAALAQGDLRTARETLSAALETDVLRQGGTGLPILGLGYWLRISYTETLARAGDVEAAAHAASDVERHRYPSFVFLEPSRMLAQAWVAAARERVTEAVTLAGAPAEFARSHGQRARVVLSIQSAIQFGDPKDHGERLAELATLVEGPRAPLVARWAAARAVDDGEALLSVSADLEEMGDRIGAADAAAHAPHLARGSGSKCGHDAGGGGGGGGGGGPMGKSGGVANHVQEPAVLVRLVMCQSHSSREPSG